MYQRISDKQYVLDSACLSFFYPLFINTVDATDIFLKNNSVKAFDVNQVKPVQSKNNSSYNTDEYAISVHVSPIKII